MIFSRMTALTDSNSDISDDTIPGWIERLYVPGEHLFGAVAVKMRKRGWIVFPQERGIKRMPSLIDNRAIKLKPILDFGTTLEDTRRWELQAPMANAAFALGDVSGRALVIDADIRDELLAADVRELAKSILGLTPFRRVGQAPKVALLYSLVDGDEYPANRSYKFVDSPTDDAIEILGNGKTLTGFGYHHKTGNYFTWEKFIPTLHGPDELPKVTAAAVQAFIDAIAEIKAFKSGSRSTVAMASFSGEMASIEGWDIPHVATGEESYDAAGLVDDGREGWLKQQAFETVRYNAGKAADSDGHNWLYNDAKREAAIEVVCRVAMERMSTAGSKFSPGAALRQEVADRVGSALGKLIAGDILHLRRAAVIAGKAVGTKKGVLPATGNQFWFLPPVTRRMAIEYSSYSAPDAVKAAARALVTDREPISIRVQLELKAALAAFLDRLYDDVDAPLRTDVILSPAGSGKTTTTYKTIAHDPRTKAFDHLPVADRAGPIVFTLPTYANIDELRERAEVLNLDNSLDDRGLAAQAVERGIYPADQVEQYIDKLRAEAGDTGIRTMVYRGKIAAGCKMAEKVKLLMDADLPTSGLCKAETITGEEELCIHYATCDAIKQRAQIAESHVVFLPHAFFSLSIPAELKKVRAVVADERIFTLFVHAALFDLEVLGRPRKELRLTAKEHESGMRPDDMIERRAIAAEIAMKALRAGKSPAVELAGYRVGKVTGLDLVSAASRICGAANESNAAIRPTMTHLAIQDACNRPVGEQVKLEHRFWRLIADWIETHHQALTTFRMAKSLGSLRAKAPVADRRIQLLHHEGKAGTTVEKVRISWRTQPNWADVPVLLLDASANERIIERIFPNREIRMHRIDADYNARFVAIVDKRQSTSSMIAGADASEKSQAACASAMETNRDLITHVAAIHSVGHVVLSSTRKVRVELTRGWTIPYNVDQIHFGAERGLNFAERHVAAIVLGRLEMPPWMYDALAAALVTDGEKLDLLDPLGTGFDKDGNALKPPLDELKIALRDGSDVGILTVRNPTGWLRIVQEQFREDGVVQSMCRIRPIFRSDTPTVYLATQAIPEGLVVDEVVAMDDMRASYMPLLDAARTIDGVLDWKMAETLRNDLATPAQFRQMFADLPTPLKDAYTVVSYAVPGNIHRRSAGVPGFHADVLEVFRKAAAAVGLAYEDVRLDRQAQRVAPAADRPVDSLHLERVDLIDLENAGNRESVERLTAENRMIPSQGRYAVRPGATPLKLTSHMLVHGIAKPPKKRVLTLMGNVADQYEQSAANAA